MSDSLHADLWEDLLGRNYVRGGRDPAVGLDCAGVVKEILRRQGISLPDPYDAFQRAMSGEPIIVESLAAAGYRRIDGPAIGALVGFDLHGCGAYDHLAMVVSTGKRPLVIHASEGLGVHAVQLSALVRMAHGTPAFWTAPVPAPVGRGVVPAAVLAERLGAGALDGALSALGAQEGKVCVVLMPDPMGNPGLRVPMLLAWREGLLVADVVPLQWRTNDVSVVCWGVSGKALDLYDELPRTGTVLMKVPAGLEGFLVSFLVGLALSALSYLLQLIFAPSLDKPKEEDSTGSPTFRLSGIRNTALTGIPIPVVYGEHIVGGNIITVFFTADSEGRQVLNMLLCLSQGPIRSIGGVISESNDLEGASIPNDIKINGTWAGEYRQVRISLRQGRSNQTPIPGFQNVVEATGYEITLVPGSPFTHTTQGSVQEVQVVVSFPAGLFRLSGTGNTNDRTVTIQVGYRVAGSGATFTTVTETITRAQRAPFSHQITLTGLAEEQYEIQVERTSPVFPNTDPAKVDQTDLVAVNDVTYDSLSYPGCALLGIRVMSDEQLPGGAPPTITSVIEGREIWVPFAGAVGGYLEQWSQSPAWVVMDMLLHAWYGGGLAAGLTLDSIDLESFAAWDAYCSTQVSDGRGGTVPRALVDMVFDTDEGIWQQVIGVARSAWCDLIWVGSKVRAVIRRASSPVAMFGMSQIAGFTLKYSGREERANVVEAGYPNAEIGYEQDQAQRVYDPNASLSSGERIIKKDLQLVGVTRPAQAYRVVQFELNYAQNTTKTATFTLGPEGITLVPGDVVSISHEAVGWGVSGRIASTTATSIVFDKEITIGPTSRVVVVTDGTGEDVLQTRAFGPGTPTTYPAGTSFTVPAWDVGDVPEAGMPYAVGDVDSYVNNFIVVSIATNDDLSRDVVAVLYSEDIYDDDPGIVEQFTDKFPDILQIPTPVQGVYVNEEAVLGLADGAGINTLVVSWIRSTLTAAVDVFFRIYDDDGEGAGAGRWKHHSRSWAEETRLIGIAPGQTVEVSVVAVSPSGTKGHPESGIRRSIRVLGRPPYPTAPPETGFDVTMHGDLLIARTPKHDDTGVDHYLVFIGSGEGRAGRPCIARVNAGSASVLPLWAIDTTTTFSFVAVNRSGIEAPEARHVALTAGEPGTLSIALERDERGSAWPGTTTNIASSGTGITNSTSGTDGVYETAGHAPTGAPVAGLLVLDAPTDLVPYDITLDEFAIGMESRALLGVLIDDVVSTGLEGSETLLLDDCGFELDGDFASLLILDTGRLTLLRDLEPLVEIRIHDGASWGDWKPYAPASYGSISQVAARVTMPGASSPWKVVLEDLFIRVYESATVDTSTLQQRWNPRSVTADATALAYDIVSADASSGNITVDLPVSPVDGDELIVKKTDASATYTVTVDGNGSTIDGETTVLLSETGDALCMVYDSDNSDWVVV